MENKNDLAEKYAESFRLKIDDAGWHEQKKRDFIAGYESAIKTHDFGGWVSAKELLPTPLSLVWVSNGKGWTTLGCLITTDEGYHWAVTNGVIYQENKEIVSECESDDWDVKFWHRVPTALKIEDATS